jgi:hypothetical protein
MDAYQSSGCSPSSISLHRDSWLTSPGIVPIAKGKQHRDYFVPEGEKPSKQFGIDRGFIRVSTLGTKGDVLHFEFKRICPKTSCLIVDAIEQSRPELVNLEFHSPTYILRSNLNPQEAISLLKREPAETTHADLVFENHLSLFLIRPVSSTGQSWLDENVGDDSTLTFGNAVVCEPRYVEAILQGATADGLVCR